MLLASSDEQSSQVGSALMTGGTASSTSTSSLSSSLSSEPLVRRNYETFDWKGYKINHRVEGEGPPLLLIHGFGGNVNHFRFQFPALTAAGYRVHAIDLLGFGASDKPADEPYSIELFVELLSDYVQSQTRTTTTSTTESTENGDTDSAKEQWIVCGNSIGGLCTLGVTQNIPDYVKACVLFNCSGGMSGFQYEDVPLLIRPLLCPIMFFVQKVVLGPQFGGRFFENFKTRENVETILGGQVYRDTTNVDEELLELILAPSDDEGAQDVFLKVFGGPPGPSPESILPNLKIPILALWGEDDAWTPLDKGLHPGNKLPEFNKRLELVTIPGAGHCPHDEAPEAVHARMIPWLAAL